MENNSPINSQDLNKPADFKGHNSSIEIKAEIDNSHNWVQTN